MNVYIQTTSGALRTQIAVSLISCWHYCVCRTLAMDGGRRGIHTVKSALFRSRTLRYCYSAGFIIHWWVNVSS